MPVKHRRAALEWARQTPGKEAAPEGRPKLGRKRPRWAATSIHNARCCTAQFMLRRTIGQRAGRRRAILSIGCFENTVPRHKKTRRWAGPQRCFAQSASELGDAADL